MFAKLFYYLQICLLAISLPANALAAMSSTNYTIYADTIGVNGGVFASSASYQIEDTTGEQGTGFVTSSSYVVRGGYQAMERGSLSVSLSSNSIALGTLSAVGVNSASTVVTITSEASTGYTLSVGSVSGSMPSPVSDGSVSAGQFEYGFSASGAHSVVSGDIAVVANQSIASASMPVTAEATTLTFKASRAAGSGNASYSQTVTLTASANF